MSDKADPEESPGVNGLIGMTVGGRRLVRKLGQGAMATVYLAHNDRIDRDEAVKISHGNLPPHAKGLLEREVRILASLEHPNIARIVDAGVESGVPGGLYFVVMEYVPGETLDFIIHKQAPLDPSRVMGLARQIASGLECAHGQAQSIVHRDLKPANVMVARTGSAEAQTEVARILDFGISRVVGQGTIRPEGTIVGSPPYMAPEQVRGDADQDGRCDLYGLGVLMYEMLTGINPFMADSAPAILKRQCDLTPLPVDAVVGKQGVSRPLAQLIDELLAKDRNDRPRSASAVVERLDVLFGSGLSAEPEPETEPDRPLGWVGRWLRGGLRRTDREIGYEELKRAVFDAIQGLHSYGPRGVSTFPAGLMLSIECPPQHRAVVAGYLDLSELRDDVEALLLNENPRLSRAGLPVWRGELANGPRFRVTASAAEQGAHGVQGRVVLVVANGDCANRWLEVPLKKQSLYVGRGEWHDYHAGLRNDLQVTQTAGFVSRAALVVRRSGAHIEVNARGEAAQYTLIHRAGGRRLSLNRSRTPWVTVEAGDTVHFGDGTDQSIQLHVVTEPPGELS